MVLLSIVFRKREFFFYSHPYRFILFLFFILIAYASGVILPLPAQIDGIVLTETNKSSATRLHERDHVFQIKDIAIRHKKASVQVLAATTVPQKEEFGVATQIGEHTWTMKVSSDDRVGTAQEILQALNAYRVRHGVGQLSWDPGLGSFAQGRADVFHRNGSTDAHAGFSDYMNNQDGFKKAGFMALGENSSYGYHIEAVHLIEWVYAGDAPHNNNQLSADWTHVGVGVAGLATDLVFGGRKM
ncbi:MAG: hypothetical protein RLZZ455_1226 [Candidatus Parcubacteria bacterium]|jgi:uncharacterized protein YkwD